MKDTVTRRHTLGLATVAVAGLVLSPPGSQLAVAETPAGFTRVEITGQVDLLTGAGTHVTVLETPAGLVIVDGGAPEHATALAAFIEETYEGAPVAALFNTHWHPSHSGLNDPLGAAGTSIHAHENTRLWMGTEYYVDWENTTYTPRAPAAQPTQTFRASDPQPRVMSVGGHTIEYGHLAEAHTDGDLYVRFVEEDVLVVGDVLSHGTYPVPDPATGGWIGGLQDATRLLLTLAGGGTQVIAGEGPPLSRADLEAQREMLDTMRERIRVRMIAAKSVEEIVAENVGEGYEHLGDPHRFVANVYNGLWWGGRLRGAY